MSKILDFVPAGYTLREAQRDLLLEIERTWKDYDLWVVCAPTAVGKTLIGYVIAKWCASQRLTTNIMGPSNVLVEQIHGSFPDIRILRRKDSYDDVIQYAVARMAAKKAPIRLMNFHVCFANKLHAAVHILDEAHTAVDMLQDNHEVRIWQREFHFPDDLRSVADVIEWAQGHIKTLDPDGRQASRLRRAIKDIIAVRGDSTLDFRSDVFRGHVSKVLVVVPGLTRKAPDWLWPKSKTRKLVFLSATINREDIRELGLSGLRVKYLECPSPIPPANRPVHARPWVNMARKYQQHSMPEFARRLREELDKRPGKGLVHIPYNLATWLRDLMGDHPRLLWHDKDNKQDILEVFKLSPPEEGKVFIASGLYEGVDLPFDLARWQVFAKVPYLSLGDEKIKKRMEKYPAGYVWEALKRIIQGCGRICRDPEDFGESLIWDSNFERLYRDALKAGLVPKYFRDAVKLLPR